MKVIVTGASGLVGGALVRECITNPAITKALVLTRKTLPDDVTDNEKVTVIMHDDFGFYPPEIIDQLRGAEGCLWCVDATGPVSNIRHHDANYEPSQGDRRSSPSFSRC